MLTIESVIRLDKLFKPRAYQRAIFDAIENKGYRKAILIWPRRAGKDITTWYLIIRQALKRKGMYFYCLPTYRQCKTVIWNAIRNDEVSFIDMIPKELIYKVNNTEMSITLTTGSIIQLIGSNSYDRALVGTNCRGIVFSEFSRSDPNSFKYTLPILQANNGFCILQSTPFGKNTFYDLYNTAYHYPDQWFLQKLTLDDTRHVDKSDIDMQVMQGVVSEQFVQQEWYTSFECGAEGSFYASIINKLYLDNKIGDFDYIPNLPVYTAWDLGYSDCTSIIYFQLVHDSIHIIDYYENNKKPLDYYCKQVLGQEYHYGGHVAPHDIQVHEYGSGLTRFEIASSLGLNFTIAPKLSIIDGIEAVRAMLPITRFNEQKTRKLVRHLENYHQEYDSFKGVFKPKPVHDISSHAADAFRMLAITYRQFKGADSAREIEERFLRVKGQQSRQWPF